MASPHRPAVRETGRHAQSGGTRGSSAGGTGELPGRGTFNERVDNLIVQSYMNTRSRGEGGWPPSMEIVQRRLSRLGVPDPSDNSVAAINDRLREASNPNTSVRHFRCMRKRAYESVV